jgi:hypothetical protein
LLASASFGAISSPFTRVLDLSFSDSLSRARLFIFSPLRRDGSLPRHHGLGLWMTKFDLVNCRRCRIPLPVLGVQNAGFLGNQRVALALEKSIWASFHG